MNSAIRRGAASRRTVNRPVCAALLLAASGAVAAESPPAEQLLQSFIDETRTLRAEFTQELIDTDGEVSQRSTGRVLIARPDRFRWDYVEPGERLVLSDGVNLWFYEADLESAKVQPLGETLATTPALLLSGDVKVSERFEVIGSETAGGLLWVNLRPREPDADFRRLSVGFAGGELRAMRLLDGLDQITALDFDALERNVTLDDAMFTFDVPSGVDLIGEPRSRPAD